MAPDSESWPHENSGGRLVRRATLQDEMLAVNITADLYRQLVQGLGREAMWRITSLKAIFTL